MNDGLVPLVQAGVPDAWGDQSRWPKQVDSGKKTYHGEETDGHEEEEGGNADDDTNAGWAYSATTASTWVRIGAPQPTG